ncbi:MAG TPA: hypothetical protein VEV17_21890 [Bryobacteraceae bacterium]|nr:hypothetical protein [Bryobacteraceae bacterium]
MKAVGSLPSPRPVAAFAEVPGNPAAPRYPLANLSPVPVRFDPPLAVDVEPVLEVSTGPEAAPEPEAAVSNPLARAIDQIVPYWCWFVTVWKKAPMELKAMAFLLPVLLGVAHVLGGVQALQASTAKKKLSNEWKSIAQVISHRAAIAFNDDFRSGLDAWESRSNLTTSWSYDSAGFVQPGPLAIFKPTQDLTDYQFEFLGEIEHKAMGCAFRAQDLDNYYALKFTEVRSGPLPSVSLVRYAVIDGKEGPRVEKQLPLSARADTLYRVVVETRGNDFIVTAQGELVDFWSDSRLKKGGVGFFCGRGEKARLRWVSVSHQYDTLGRLCAFLVPSSLGGLGGS